MGKRFFELITKIILILNNLPKYNNPPMKVFDFKLF